MIFVVFFHCILHYLQLHIFRGISIAFDFELSRKSIQIRNHMIGTELHEKSIDLGTLTVT